MPYRIIDIELSGPLPAVRLEGEEDGLAVVARWRDELVGFSMQPAARGAAWTSDELRALAEGAFARRVVTRIVAAELAPRAPPPAAPAPSLTIAICTKDRAARLARLLASLDAVRGGSGFADLEVIVVDNAPSDEATRDAVARFDGVRYHREPRAGLDFARNAALSAAHGDLLAFLDDDVVVDRNWLAGLLSAWRRRPDAGGFTGLVLPYRLDTPAQIHFEAKGGFGRGFAPDEFHGARWGNMFHPVSAGILGAGCNMAFDRRLLLDIGGFDEALDTGAPLPGGGDLDIFYRVLRTGRVMAYEPRYAVYHEHRETLPQLRRQYWSWGLGFMAFLQKSRGSDPALRDRQRGMVRWWMLEMTGKMLGALVRRRWRDLRFLAAEFQGGLQGLAGEYERSQARSRRIREQAS